MLSSRTRVLIGGASALAVSVLVALPASATTGPAIRTVQPGHVHVLYDVGIHSNVTRAQALAGATTASSSFSQFKAAVTVGTKSYTYVMAGLNPAVKVSNATATIKTELVPVIVKVQGTTVSWDPTKIDSCDTGASALSRVQKSPIFTNQSWTFGGTSIGTGQVTDAFQRAEFWKYAQGTGINPSYNVNLSVTTLKPVTITVPGSEAFGIKISCGNGFIGDIPISFLQSAIQKTVIPSLATQGVGPSTLPVFVVHNVVEFIGTNPNNCCVLGFHNAFSRTSGVQTYGISWYNNSHSSLFSNASDVAALSHEVGEWQDDPYTNNPTPSWGHVGQVSGCQTNLEVGDPLSGTTFAHTENGFTYHVQELAFFSWFYHQSPSLGVNGWYSDQGKFRTFAANC